MATNSGRGNPIAAEDGPPACNTSSPPALASDVKSAILRQEQDPNSLQHGGVNSTGLHDATATAAGEGKGKHPAPTSTSTSTTGKPPLPRAEDEPRPNEKEN